jgi:ankyrin repeat protein
MSRSLSLNSSLETFRKDAKRWLKALRAGDAQARARLIAALGAAPDDVPTEVNLRDVQLALAREYGLPGWGALRQALDELALARRSSAERVEIVLRSAAWGGDRTAAARIIGRWPEISSVNLLIATVAGHLDEVERRLASNPSAATKKGGPLDREPLLYLTYARLPGGDAHAVGIATALLDRGADANAAWLDDWGNPFTALTGVIGNGEIDEPPHPKANELAALLIERGANPFDTQALYNTAVTRDDVTWLELLWSASERRGALDRWREVPTGRRIGGSIPMSALDYLLGVAVSHHHPLRAEWLLKHGANPNTLHSYSRQPVRDVALGNGNQRLADLLEKHGAEATPLRAPAAFMSACMRLDEATARALLAEHSFGLHHAHPMLVAASAGRADAVALLLKLGVPVDVADGSQRRGLHSAVERNSLEVVKLLVAHGADVDRPTTRYPGPLGWAAHFKRPEIAAFLAPLSRDVHSLVRLGMRERLLELFAADPSLVNAADPKSSATPLFALPDDEDAAADMAAFLLSHGANPRARNKDGVTPEQAARQRGLIDAADLLQEA